MFVHVTFRREWLGSPLVELRYVMRVRFMDDVVFARNGRSMRRKKRHISYAKLLNNEQHGFDSPGYTQTGPPEGSTWLERSLISTIALCYVYVM